MRESINNFVQEVVCLLLIFLECDSSPTPNTFNPPSKLSLTYLKGGLCMHALHNEELVVLTTEWLPWLLAN